MDQVRVSGIKTEAVIGVHDWERRLPRTLTVDVQLGADVARAAASDRIEDAVDYHAVAEAVKAFVAASRVQLVETLAERLAAHLLAKFRLPSVSLTVHKPGAVPGAQDVSVSITRGA